LTQAKKNDSTFFWKLPRREEGKRKKEEGGKVTSPLFFPPLSLLGRREKS